jgi:hypothetical protein
MNNEELSKDAQGGLYDSLKVFVNTLKESPDNESKISGILTLLESVIELLEADRNVSFQQNKAIHSINKSLQANLNVANEFDDRFTTLEKNVTDLALNTSKINNGVVKLTEIIKKMNQ